LTLAVDVARVTEPMNEARERPSDDAAAEQVSPELALVDADLARIARAHLPDPPEDSHADSGSRVEAALVVAETPTTNSPAVAAPVSGTRAPTHRRRRVTWVGLVFLALLMGLAGFALGSGRLADDELEPQPVNVEAAPGAAEGDDRLAQPPPAPGAAARSPKPTPPAAMPAARRLPAQVFVWLPARGASHYKVEFSREGAKIFEALPSRPRVEVPSRWKYGGRRFVLSPGRYVWSVRPGFGPRTNARYGKTIVRSTWVAVG
jgi:hypothetical protein